MIFPKKAATTAIPAIGATMRKKFTKKAVARFASFTSGL